MRGSLSASKARPVERLDETKEAILNELDETCTAVALLNLNKKACSFGGARNRDDKTNFT